MCMDKFRLEYCAWLAQPDHTSTLIRSVSEHPQADADHPAFRIDVCRVTVPDSAGRVVRVMADVLFIHYYVRH